MDDRLDRDVDGGRWTEQAAVARAASSSSAGELMERALSVGPTMGSGARRQRSAEERVSMVAAHGGEGINGGGTDSAVARGRGG